MDDTTLASPTSFYSRCEHCEAKPAIKPLKIDKSTMPTRSESHECLLVRSVEKATVTEQNGLADEVRRPRRLQRPERIRVREVYGSQIGSPLPSPRSPTENEVQKFARLPNASGGQSRPRPLAMTSSPPHRLPLTLRNTPSMTDDAYIEKQTNSTMKRTTQLLNLFSLILFFLFWVAWLVIRGFVNPPNAYSRSMSFGHSVLEGFYMWFFCNAFQLVMVHLLMTAGRAFKKFGSGDKEKLCLAAFSVFMLLQVWVQAVVYAWFVAGIPGIEEMGTGKVS
ncbi:hypothetical protein MMC25_005374 [Agyrium rufum]|nr:hypothetical protein [Agyrium rufum]